MREVSAKRLPGTLPDMHEDATRCSRGVAPAGLRKRGAVSERLRALNPAVVIHSVSYIAERQEPPLGQGTDSGVKAELAARRGYGTQKAAQPGAVFGELWRVAAGGPADDAGVTWERIDANKSVFRPNPEDDRRSTPQLFPYHPAGPALTGRVR
jgi:hypothetical protein